MRIIRTMNMSKESNCLEADSFKLAHNDFEFLICELRARIIKERIIKTLDEDPNNYDDIIKYLKNHSINVFPYDFVDRYKVDDVKIYRDDYCGLFYTVLYGEKIYLSSRYKSKFRAARYMKNIYLEQDEHSPHRYITNEFCPQDDCVIIDIGGAEGIFAFSYLNKAKKIYIFEPEDHWIDALRCTFEKYKDKVEIVKKFVSDKNDEKNITLDKFIEDKNISNEKLFIKIDAEGAEPKILEGLLKSKNNGINMMLCVCAYHCDNHEKFIRDYFEGWNIKNSDGYMLYYYDFMFSKPFLRRGILRIKKD